MGDLLGQSRELQTPAGQVSLAVWHNAVGVQIAARTRPERLTKGILWVRVPSSTWAQELSFQAETILPRLRSAGLEVEALRFRVVATEQAATAKPPRVTVSRRATLPADLQRRIEQLDDPELKAVLADAASLSLGLRKR